VTEEVALLATFDWEDWSTADDLAITLGPATVEASTGFQDTYKVGVGMNYRLSADWLLQTGVTIDTSGFKNKDRTVAIPIDRQVRFSVGARHDLGDALQLGLSFTYANLGQAEIRQGTVSGDYRHNDLFFLGLTIGYDNLPWSGMLTLAD
jgi:long-chain fatty acid transport protein